MIGRKWERQRLRYICKVNPIRGKKDSLPIDTEVSFVPMDSIGEQGSLSLERTKLIEEVSSGYTYFEEGDVVFAKITPCFENGKGTLAKKLVNGVAFGTTELHVLRPLASSDGRFLYYLTCSDEFRKNGESWMYGAGGQKRVPEDFVKDYSFRFPPLAIQKTIAAYLDKETSRIDALIAKKERQIELLEEKRQAIITRAITKGLDPKAKMKDSGVEWIGEIPEEWQVRRIKSVAPVQGGYAFKSESFQEKGIPVVRMNNLKRGSLSIEDAACVQTEEVPRAFLLKEDDLLIGMSGSLGATGSLGNFAVVRKDDLPAALNQRVGRFLLSDVIFSVMYLRQIIQSAIFAEPISLFSNGTAQFNISSDQIGSIFIPCPPLDEQKAIGNHCESSTYSISALKNRISSSLELLREYRSSLITAAVSGQIDISQEVVK